MYKMMMYICEFWNRTMSAIQPLPKITLWLCNPRRLWTTCFQELFHNKRLPKRQTTATLPNHSAMCPQTEKIVFYWGGLCLLLPWSSTGNHTLRTTTQCWTYSVLNTFQTVQIFDSKFMHTINWQEVNRKMFYDLKSAIVLSPFSSTFYWIILCLGISIRISGL